MFHYQIWVVNNGYIRNKFVFETKAEMFEYIPKVELKENDIMHFYYITRNCDGTIIREDLELV